MMPERIRQMRLEHQMTQEELANKLGLQKSAIAKYENGRVTNVKRSTIQKMAEIFDCSPAWLMGLDKEVPDNQVDVLIQAQNHAGHLKQYLGLSQRKRGFVDHFMDVLYDLPEKDAEKLSSIIDQILTV